MFDGKLLGGNTNMVGGFVGWCNRDVSIRNCLYAPAKPSDSETWAGADGSKTFGRFDKNAPTISICYYTRTLGEPQGDLVYTITTDENVAIDAGAATNAYSSGVTFCAQGLQFNGAFLAQSGKTLTLTHSERTGYTFSRYNASAGTLNGATLTVPGEDVTVTATYTANPYTVIFDKNADDATGTMEPQGFTYDTAQALSANAYTREGYRFEGWATAADGAVAYTDGQSVSSLTTGGSVTLYAVWTGMVYLDEDGAEQARDDYTVLTSGDTAWTNDWYVVADNTTIGSRATVSGDVYLILCDGAKLTVNGGVTVGEGDSLTIYAQSDGADMGALTVSGVTDLCAGIGGYNGAGGAITINGGTVTVTGGAVTAIGGENGVDIGCDKGRSLTLRFADPGDSLKASSISGTVTVADNFYYTDDASGKYYPGELTEAQKTALGGRTLTSAEAYAVAVSDGITGGTVTSDKSVAIVGDTVTLSVTPNACYELSAATYTVDGGSPVNIENLAFVMPDGNVTVNAVLEPITWEGSGVFTATGDIRLNGMILTGDTIIDLAEGATLTLDGGEYQSATFGKAIHCKDGNLHDLTVRGQGKLILEGLYGGAVRNLRIEGGDVEDNASSIDSDSSVMTGGSFAGELAGSDIAISGGRVSGTIDAGEGGVSISGGRIDATGGILSYIWHWKTDEETLYPITLGCADENDVIFAAFYKGSPVQIADGQTLYDEAGVAYSGTLTEEQIAAISNHTLTKTPRPRFGGHAMVLSGEIGVKFRVVFPAGFDTTGCYVRFTLSDGRTFDVPYAKAERIEDSRDRFFICRINALELADDITATLYYAGGETEQTYSAMAYAEAVRARYSENENLMEMLDAMQNYGHYLQLSGWGDKREHQEIGAAAELNADSVEAAKAEVSGMAFSKTLGGGMEAVRYALTLNAETKLTILVQPADGETVTTEGFAESQTNAGCYSTPRRKSDRKIWERRSASRWRQRRAARRRRFPSAPCPMSAPS